MNDDFAKKVRSAAIAGWWTLLIAAIFLTIQWFVFLGFVNCRPAWVVKFWGGVSWETIQTVGLWMTGIFKMIIWVFAMVVVWLSLWARGLRKS